MERKPEPELMDSEEQTQAYAELGCDQVVFGFPFEIPHQDALDCIRLYGEHVIPRFDTDPLHRSTRRRMGSLPQPRHPRPGVPA